MANPYHLIVNAGADSFDGTAGDSGTAFLFNPAVGTVVKGDGTSKLGSLGVSAKVVDDTELVQAINALAYNDAERWPQSGVGGSAVPLNTWLVDCPEANIVVNWMGKGAGFLSGIPDFPAAYSGLAGSATLTSVSVVDPPPAAGTVPYVNPRAAGNPDAIFAINFLLDDGDFHLG